MYLNKLNEKLGRLMYFVDFGESVERVSIGV